MTADHAPGFLGQSKAVVGMVHLAALPGTPKNELSPTRIAERAVAEARLLEGAGFDAIILENMHDAPYVWGNHGPEITAAMTLAAAAVRDAVRVPIGIQVLSGGHLEALSVAHATGCAFIRCENFVFSHVADEGLIERAIAGQLLRERRRIGATEVKIFADIKKKHSSHAITGDLSIEEAAEGALFFGADGLIVSGTATGKPADEKELAAVRSAGPHVPLIVGSGATPETMATLFEHADAVIVGSWMKRDGLWSNEPDPERAKTLIDAAAAAR